MKAYYFDSYALFELVKGNENYAEFKKDVKMVTTKLNLMELFYGLLKDGRENSEHYYDRFLPYAVGISDSVIKDAMKFKLQHGKLSYVDCLGYIMSLKMGMKFLTGDNHFAGFSNVAFVK